MNRRSFFATLFAAPAAASLPQTTRVPAAKLVAGLTITAREIIYRALVTIGVLSPGELPSAAVSEYALGLLNEIMACLFRTPTVLRLNTAVPLGYACYLRTKLAYGLATTHGWTGHFKASR